MGRKTGISTQENMMRSTIIYKVLGSAALSLALTGMAAAQPSSARTSEPARPASPAAAKGAMTLGMSAAQTERVADGLRAKNFIRARIYNDANQMIGRVDDLIVAPDDSSATTIVDV